MYGMTNSGNLFSDELTNWLIDIAGFNQSKYQISVYYKYAPDSSKLVLLFYIDGCVYWYKYEELGKCFVVTPGKIFRVNFLGYAHWFMSINISQIKEQSISMDQAIYATYVVTNYLDTTTKKNIQCL